MHKLWLSSLALLLLEIVRVYCGEIRIHNASELIQFKDDVRSGTDYSGSTVFLDSDLSLAGKTFEPIGTDSNYFFGVFDGQGHVISNLNMSSSSLQYVGLFGYSTGLTIKNVILDSSCSITSSYSSSYYVYIGGIIGYCISKDKLCTIENSVDMGSVAFSGYAGSGMFIGGIAGYLISSNHDITVKNCANYGDVTFSGTTYSLCIGGIVGQFLDSSLTNKVFIYNCLNYGTVTHNGATTNTIHMGGFLDTPNTQLSRIV